MKGWFNGTKKILTKGTVIGGIPVCMLIFLIAAKVSSYINAYQHKGSDNTRQTQRNLNMLIIGGSGTGKSRFFVKPNLCEMPLNSDF